MNNENKLKLPRRLLVGAAIAMAVAFAAPLAHAQQSGISDARARAIALRAVPGVVVEVESLAELLRHLREREPINAP